MGTDIDRTVFTDRDYARFRGRLQDNLAELRSLLAEPGFGAGPPSLGAELEMYIVDSAGRPLFRNQEIQARVGDPQLTVELNRYNLEYNLSPYRMDQAPLYSTQREIETKLAALRRVLAAEGGRVVPIGILPTLKQSDFGPAGITDRQRYHALVNQCISRRGSAFKIDINGENPLKIDMADITLEGANTSFQVHYRVAPADYADTFNAILLVAPLAMAIGANSPTLFGHSLWHETRVPLFKQSIDTRHIHRYGWNEPPRVNYGHGWVRRSALELFEETVAIYPPLLPICAEHPEPGALAELRLHQSTVWPWNRPIYDPAGGGMLRIEMRSLPAGPTPVDMVANAALLVGMAEGIRPRIERLLPALPFRAADYNFHRAAQFGLDARLVWPLEDQCGCREQSVLTLLEAMLPCARAGLEAIGVSAGEAGHYLDVIARRLQRRQTGAIWQRRLLARLRRELPLEEALHRLLETYHEHSLAGTPVAEWPL